MNTNEQAPKEELYPATDQERQSLIDWYKDHSNIDLHDDGINTLCKICPPEQFGEDDDCEALQNIMRVMFYRIADLESVISDRDKLIRLMAEAGGKPEAQLKRNREALEEIKSVKAFGRTFEIAEQALKEEI